MKICGIYKITSPSNKIYIEQSRDVAGRWGGYKRLDCKAQVKLYHSFKKYGYDRHKLEIIHQCQHEQLNELEKYYVDLFQTFNSEFGLNLRDGGGCHGKASIETLEKMRINRIGKKHSEKQKEKIRLSLLGNKRALGVKHTDEMNLRQSLRRRGHVFSEDTKKKISESHKGLRHTDETKKKLSEFFKKNPANFWKGKSFSDEMKQKMSVAKIGKKRKPFTDETIQRMRIASKLRGGAAGWVKGMTPLNIGKKHTEETRRKMSEAQKLRQTKLKLDKKQ